MKDSTLKSDPIDQEADGLDPDDIDTGSPIPQLQALEAPTKPGFLGRLRRRIDGTKFAGDATTFAWTAPWLLFRELLEMLFGGASHRGTPPEAQGPGQEAEPNLPDEDAPPGSAPPSDKPS